MVVGAFPIAKLTVLLIKQISKPIANVCKERAKSHPFFRTYVCMPPAQFYNWCEVKSKMWILNLGKPVNIPVLSQEMAIELGANLLGEGIIFVIGAGLLIIEYRRQSNKETAKETKREEEWKHLTATLTDLFFTVQNQKAKIQEIERTLHAITAGEIKPSGDPGSGKKSISPTNREAPNGSDPPKNIHFMSHGYDQDCQPTIATPYPNDGIILRSLNYLQMDVMSSSVIAGIHNQAPPLSKSTARKSVSPNHKQEPAVLMGALKDIENNFRSLF